MKTMNSSEASHPSVPEVYEVEIIKTSPKFTDIILNETNSNDTFTFQGKILSATQFFEHPNSSY